MIEIMKMAMIMSMIMPWMNHPLSMGLVLIIQTLTVSMIAGNIMNSFWYSYIIVISMLSGMLVLFMYMASVASNEKFFSSTKMTTIILIATIMLFSYIENNKIKNDVMKTDKNTYIEIDQMLNMSKFMNSMSTITIMMALYLFFTMIVVSYNTNIYEGPMRKKLS